MFILLTYVFRVSVGARFSLLCLAHNICVWFLVCNVLHVGRLLVVWICICFVRRCVVCYYLLFPWCLLSSGKWRGVVFVFVWGGGGGGLQIRNCRRFFLLFLLRLWIVSSV